MSILSEELQTPSLPQLADRSPVDETNETPSPQGVRRRSQGNTLFLVLANWRRMWQGLLQPPWSFCVDWPLRWPLFVLAAMTLMFRYTTLDRAISSWFYDAEAYNWPWFFSTPCTLFYRIGIYPPFALVSCGGVLLLFGRLIDGTNSLSRAGLFLVLVMAIGPGLIVNLGFKGNWGRARPHQVQEFGGDYAFSPVGSPGPMLHGNSSFPSGHAAIAFYLMAPGFLVSRQRPRLARNLFLGGVAYGLCMSATRVIQGGHFTSDVLWAGGIVYLVGAILAKLILRENPFIHRGAAEMNLGPEDRAGNSTANA